MAKTKFFRIAVEGATATDGRIIKREWIDQSAAGFNLQTYTPRINCEHIRGFSPEPPFNAYGSVIALKAEDYQIEIDGKTVTKRALYAQFDANDQLIALNAKNQKIFTSCEFTEDFAQTGKAALVGLAVTDNPASLGTEALSFSAFKPMWDARKSDPANFFSSAEEISFALEDGPAAQVDDATKGLFAAVTEALKSFVKKPDAPVVPPVAPVPTNDNDARFAAIADGLTKLSAAVEGSVAKVANDVSALSTDLGKLKADLSATEQPNGPKRTLATGGDGQAFARTDC
jgi:hypothetical protein